MGGLWLPLEESSNLVIRCRRKIQTENFFHICVGDVMLFNHQKCSETN